MKRTIVLLFAAVLFLGANAQYNDAYRTVETMLNPDNSDAKAIKKAGYKMVEVTGYEPDAEDTSETIFKHSLKKYDEEGRLVYVSYYPEANAPYSAYAYDEDDRVIKYTEHANGKDEVFDFEYDKKKGFKNIKYTGSKNFQWVDSLSALIETTPLDTQYYYFNKDLKLVKHSRKMREENYAAGYYYSDSTFYTYDKKDNLVSYTYTSVSKLGDTVAKETGEHSYNKDRKLNRVMVKLYDYSFRTHQPKKRYEHTYAYAQKSGRLVNHSMILYSYYSIEDKMTNDQSSIDNQYTYNKAGLPVKMASSSDPGVVINYVYVYSK